MTTRQVVCFIVLFGICMLVNRKSISRNFRNLTNMFMRQLLLPELQRYRPVPHHWFFKKEDRITWQPFSITDSRALEKAFLSKDVTAKTVVATDGGRYDVNIFRRERIPVYWTGPATEVRRCSWFHDKHTEGRLEPYEENIAIMLEDVFKAAYETNLWNCIVHLPDGDHATFYGPDALVLSSPKKFPDTWANTLEPEPKQHALKRGVGEFNIDKGERRTIDHLLFIVHGIGSACDLKFRTVTEVVDDFRSIALQLVRSHYNSAYKNRLIHRVEVLPISWHASLHSKETGIDESLKTITLESIPYLRNFTNDTLIDILFYTSPIYCQTIISTVAGELNRIYDLFKQRNPSFTGGVSLGGHSLGSLILFDLLSHQYSESETETEISNAVVVDDLAAEPQGKRLSRRISSMMWEAGTGQPQLQYPQLNFQPNALFTLGSPIGVFITVRGLEKLGNDFALPTCPKFFNVFHPYDPVAYRIESLINPELAKLKPVLIPHHKGRKRMHLEMKDTMMRVGVKWKQKLLEYLRFIWNVFLEPDSTEQDISEIESDGKLSSDNIPEEHKLLYLGVLNNGRRIDYVLQEAPFEFINEYIFALTSHVCYWESVDTVLLMISEIYSSMGIEPDNPQRGSPL